MLSVPSSVPIYLALEPVNFPKAHDGLPAIIRDVSEDDAFQGALFVFLNRRPDRVKLFVEARRNEIQRCLLGRAG